MNARLLTLGLLVVSTACYLGAAPTAYSQTRPAGKADPRIGKLLDQLGWKYEIDSDGDYKLCFRYGDGRTQIVFVRSRTLDVNGLELREVFAAGVEAGKNPSAQLTFDLLQANAHVKIGAWRLVEMRDGYCGVFSVMIGGDVDQDTLRTAVNGAGITADEKEKEVHGTDKL